MTRRGAGGGRDGLKRRGRAREVGRVSNHVCDPPPPRLLLPLGDVDVLLCCIVLCIGKKIEGNPRETQRCKKEGLGLVLHTVPETSG